MRSNFNCYGIDFYRPFYVYAKTRFPDIKFYHSDINNLYILKKNDVITACDVLEHIKNPQKVIKQVYELLNKDGIFFVKVPNLNSLDKKLKGKDWFGYTDKTHVSLLSEEQWSKLFVKNNFKIVKKYYEGYFDIPYFKKLKTIQKLFLLPGIFTYIAGINILSKKGENIIFVLRR